MKMIKLPVSVCKYADLPFSLWFLLDHQDQVDLLHPVSKINQYKFNKIKIQHSYFKSDKIKEAPLLHYIMQKMSVYMLLKIHLLNTNLL